MVVDGELVFAAAEGRLPQARPSVSGLDEEREMAIAPLLDTQGADWSADLYGAPWPRPALRLVADRGWVATDTEVAGGDTLSVLPSSAVSRAVVPPLPQAGEDVARRRARRAAIRRRRRAAVLAGVAVVLTCGLALPLASLGGSPAAAGHPDAGATVGGATVYVVRPGDTLWSIAARFEREGNPRPMAEALAREVGSAFVVPGERISIP
jgi:hypothetical protein